MSLIIKSQGLGRTRFNVGATNDESINCGNDSSLDIEFDDELTICGFVEFESVNTNQFIWSRQQDTGDNMGYNVLMLSNGKIRFGLVHDSAPDVRATIDTVDTFNLSQKYFISVVTEGTGTTPGMKIYINADLQAVTTDINSLGGNSITNNSSFIIGARGSNTLPFKGFQSNISIYNVAQPQLVLDEIFQKGDIFPDYSSINGIVSHLRLKDLNPVDQIGPNNGTSILMDSSNLVGNDGDIPGFKGLVIKSQGADIPNNIGFKIVEQ